MDEGEEVAGAGSGDSDFDFAVGLVFGEFGAGVVVGEDYACFPDEGLVGN